MRVRRPVVGLLVGLPLLLPAVAHGDYTFVREFGRDQASNAEGVAASGGDVYVPDYYSSSIVKFDGSGKYLTEFGGTQLYHPGGIGTDSSGNVYVTDSFHGVAHEYDGDGNYVTQFGGAELDWPSDVATDLAGNVYVGDYIKRVVDKYDASGNFITQFGATQLSQPEGVATDPAGDVYVANYGHNVIDKYDANGNFITEFGGDRLSGPNGVGTDAAGAVYVADLHHNAIEKFDANGNYLTQFGRGHLPSPNGVAIDQAGDVYVSNGAPYGGVEEFAPGPPPPVLGKSVNASPVSGKPRVKLRGTSQFKPLNSETQIPVGSTVNTTKGKVDLTSAVNRSGSKTEQGDFSKGTFKVTQEKGGQHYTQLELLGGPGPCGSRNWLLKHGGGNGLYGSSHGHFRTRGHHGSGSVPGKAGTTDWQTSEQCDGTYFAVSKGTLTVRDFTLDRTVTLHAGEHYLAPAHR
jgi:streptogramin lyase